MIEESIEDDLDNDTLDKASSLDKDLEYEDSPRTRTQTASVQTSAHVSVIDKSRLREKSVQTAVEEAPQIKGNKDPCDINWDDTSCDDEATQIQAGYRGMIARERMEAEENKIKKEIAIRKRERNSITMLLEPSVSLSDFNKFIFKVECYFRCCNSSSLVSP